MKLYMGDLPTKALSPGRTSLNETGETSDLWFECTDDINI